MSSSETPLSDFTSIGTRISLYKPPSTAKPKSNTAAPDPLLIIVCSWMGASPRHVAKYTAEHQARFPHAQILLIQNSLGDLLFSTPGQRRGRMKPAAAVVRAFEAARREDAAHRGRIVLHAFSNGGGYFACQLAAVLAVPESDGRDRTSDLKLDGLILDSCPGQGGHMRTVNAVAVSLPQTLSSPMRLIAKALIHVLILFMKVMRILLRRENVVREVGHSLNRVQGAFGPHVPRVYLYSKADKMVAWNEVQDHAAEARQVVGAEVKEVVFKGSPHCGHVFENAQRYWEAVYEVICRGLS